ESMPARKAFANKAFKELKWSSGGGGGGGGEDPKPDPEPEPDPPIVIPDKPDVPKIDLSSILDYFEKFIKDLIKEIEKMLIVNLYDYGQSYTSGNKFLRVDRKFKNIRKIKPSINFKKIIDDMVELGKKETNKL